MDLTDLFTLARAMKLSDRQATEIENENANVITKRRTKSRSRNKTHFVKKAEVSNKKQYRNQTCRNCGGENPHKYRQCPAKGRQCNFCKNKNHFAKACRSRRKKASMKEVDKIEVLHLRAQMKVTSLDCELEIVITLNSMKPKQPHTVRNRWNTNRSTD
ncbi:hypothetical protein CHS0354_028703 [Potamilus streckersoni]|uniref:CCHC-type domain-containing protein n=1 Tax=Potamilus streckersoni TaxID=2493646 RepID=A0AAE0SLS9_9BIVA|nr:hypothetical protein CHS0354_028703 [Potamilus streckersoni]